MTTDNNTQRQHSVGAAFVAHRTALRRSVFYPIYFKPLLYAGVAFFDTKLYYI